MLPAEAAREVPFLFKKGPESSAVQEAVERLTSEIHGAVFIKKLTTAAANAASTRKRARCADLSDEKPPPAKKVTTKAKNKAKTQGKAKAQAQRYLMDGETEETMQSAIEVSLDDMADGATGARARLWLDDLMAAIRCCTSGPCQVTADSSSSRVSTGLIGALVGYGLEFALTGQVVVQKKVLQTWSKARQTF